MAKIRLIPQTREFYTLFDRAAQNLVTTARLLLDLLEHYPDRRDLVEKIKECEHEVDEVPPEAIEQAGVILKTVGKLADAIRCLEGLKDVSQTLVDIHTLEDEGD